MKIKLLAMLLIIALLLTACGYVVVENPERQKIAALFLPVASAEGEGDAAETDLTEEIPLSLEDGPLSRGDAGERVKRLQTALRRVGFLNGKADGYFGEKTESAVMAAQDYLHEKDEEKAALALERFRETVKRAQEMRMSALDALRTPDSDSASKSDDLTVASVSVNLMPNEPEKAFRADGVATDEFVSFLEDEFSVYVNDLKNGSEGSDVRRLQTRLKLNNYLAGSVDGSFGSGTKDAVKYFQRLNGLKETGEADERTQKLLFSEDCKVAQYPAYRYKVEISVSKQRVYVYEWNYGSYSKLVKTMKCTTGAVDTPTPLGSFRMGGPCGRWYYFKKFECWAQYASRITGGILFHSVLYSEKDEKTLRAGSVAALGSRASHGCVRLSVADAKWIYNNIPAGTTCRVYN